MSTIIASDTTPNYGTISRQTSSASLSARSTRSSDSERYESLGKLEVVEYPTLSLLQTSTIITSLSGITFCSSLATGLLTVCLPTIAEDVQLPSHLLLWPSSAYSLACGCCLLLAGSVADKVGDKLVNITGSATLAVFVLASGLSQDGSQLIMSRILQGVGVSMSLPTGVSIVTRSLAPGRRRNVAFSCLGFAQPLGFSLGLVMGGAVQASGGWRLGYYLCAGVLGMFVAMGLVSLPPNERLFTLLDIPSLFTDIDWFGIFLSSTGLGLISYICIVLTQDPGLLWEVVNSSALVVGIASIASFPWWMQRQVRYGRPALIPNSIWANRGFVAISITVFLAWASLQSSELLTSLFFQRVQEISPLKASFELLPNVVMGFIVNPLTGLTVHRFTYYKLIVSSSIIAAASPLILALINPAWSYWVAACWAVALAPVSIDVLFTIAHMIITDVFPPNMHALAGAVFNTISQLGTSLGMSMMAVVSSSVTKASDVPDKESPEAIMEGYRAAFWTCAVLMLLSAVTSLGLRNMQKPENQTQADADDDE